MSYRLIARHPAITLAALFLAAAAPLAAQKSSPPRARAATIVKSSPRVYMKKSDAELKKTLTPIQYHVTQEDGTEPPFRNEYWDNHEDGIYVDVVSGEALFSSKDKYESHTGWPSFTRPLEVGNVRTKTDTQFGMERTEVRSAAANSHLGHLFNDGPQPSGNRYCMNSASMRFVPVAKLEAEGYGTYLPLFTPTASAKKAQ